MVMMRSNRLLQSAPTMCAVVSAPSLMWLWTTILWPWFAIVSSKTLVLFCRNLKLVFWTPPPLLAFSFLWILFIGAWQSLVLAFILTLAPKTTKDYNGSCEQQLLWICSVEEVVRHEEDETLDFTLYRCDRCLHG